MIASIWNYRKFIWQSAWRDLQHRYAGSSMGFLWNVINPLFQILLYTMVFSQLMKVKIPNLSSGFGFAIYLCAGLIPWIGFSETLTRCTNSFIENANYLKKLAIPEHIFVIQSACSSFMSLVISMFLLVVECLLLGHYPDWLWLTLLPLLFMWQAFAFGIGLFLGVMNAFFRDISQILSLVMQIWFWLTPIVYLEEALPERVRDWLYLNPTYHFIRVMHGIIVDKAWPADASLAMMIGVAVGLPLLGYFALMKLRAEIRDVL